MFRTSSLESTIHRLFLPRPLPPSLRPRPPPVGYDTLRRKFGADSFWVNGPYHAIMTALTPPDYAGMQATKIDSAIENCASYRKSTFHMQNVCF